MTDDTTPVDRSAGPPDGHLLPRVEDDRGPLVLDRAAPRAIEWAADRLVEGGVVAFPTDTVYALAASLAHPAALDRIFALKARPAAKPLPVLLASATDLERIALDLDDRVVALVARYWPGPLTVIVAAREGMPERVLGPHRTVGARVPNHFLALEIIERAGGAVAATSANRSGSPPAQIAAHVTEQLGAGIDLLLDGGRTPGGVASTVVGFAGDELVFLREGAIARDHLLASWRELAADERDS